MCRWDTIATDGRGRRGRLKPRLKALRATKPASAGWDVFDALEPAEAGFVAVSP